MDNYNYDYNTGRYTETTQSQTYESDFVQTDVGFGSINPATPKASSLKSIMKERVVAYSFLFMLAALLITAFAAFNTTFDVAATLLSGYNFVILCFAEIGIVMAANWALRKNNAILGGILFTIYAYINGMTLSIIFLVYTASSIVSVFLIAAALFGIMAVYGIVTRKDLSSVGNLLFMGLLGIIIAGFINIFILKSTMFDTVICIIGILVFVGLTAYDTQKIKNMVAYSNNQNVLSLALFGAMQLYLDFINLFLKLLRLLGRKK